MEEQKENGRIVQKGSQYTVIPTRLALDENIPALPFRILLLIMSFHQEGIKVDKKDIIEKILANEGEIETALTWLYRAGYIDKDLNLN